MKHGIEILVGEILTGLEFDDENIIFKTTNNIHKLYRNNEYNGHCYVSNIEGNISDIIGIPITSAKELNECCYLISTNRGSVKLKWVVVEYLKQNLNYLNTKIQINQPNKIYINKEMEQIEFPSPHRDYTKYPYDQGFYQYWNKNCHTSDVDFRTFGENYYERRVCNYTNTQCTTCINKTKTNGLFGFIKNLLK